MGISLSNQLKRFFSDIQDATVKITTYSIKTAHSFNHNAQLSPPKNRVLISDIKWVAGKI
jgi:hypothetical protein